MTNARLTILMLLALETTLFSSGSAQSERKSEDVPSLWTRTQGVDWPRMLGKDYDSTSPETGIATDWGPNGLRVLWALKTGVGYGNGVASHGRWFQFDRFGDQECLTCLNAEKGTELWRWESPVEYQDPYGYNNGPRCSPVVDGNRVYVYGVAGNLACLSVVDGKVLWSLNINEKYGVIPNFFGVGASPLVYGDWLWVMVGGSSPNGTQTVSKSVNDLPYAKPNGTAMVAFNKWTGKEAMRIGDYLASYSAPVVLRVGGADLLLALVREGLLTFDPKSGENPQFTPWRSRILESVNAASPVLYQGKVLISETYEIGSALIDVLPKGHKLLWKDAISKRGQVMRAHWNTPLVVDDTVYVSSGRNEPDTDLRAVQWRGVGGVSPAIEARVAWSLRNRDRMTGLVVDGHVLLLGESGLLQLIKTNSQKMETVAEMQLAERIDPKDGQPLVQTPSWAPPVLSHGLLYVRGANKVICMELIGSTTVRK